MPHVEPAQTRRVVSAIRTVPGESAAQFNELLDKLPAGAYTCNVDGLITYFNRHAQELWGRAPRLNHPADRWCGSFKLFNKDGAPIRHDECWMALAVKNRRQYDGEEIIVERPDGERLTVLAHANPIHDKNGRVIGAVNVLVDITERKRFEATLQEADRKKNEFLATLAHELRNPLAPVRSALQILRMSGSKSTEGKAALDIADRQMAQMVRLVEDLLDVSRITRNKLQLQRGIVPLQDVLQLALESSKPYIDAGGQTFEFDVPIVPIYVDVDSTRVAQVISNLLNNAAKFTPADGRIVLRAWAERNEVAISVRDSGIGLAPEAIPAMFEMFAQASDSPSRARGGLGIGLSLVKRLVEMHAGSVIASSEGPGKGSEFVVRLPTVAAPAAMHASEAPAALQSNGTTLRLLVVDDNRDAADTLCVLLQMLGHETRVAYDGESALTTAEDYKPDVVLLDIGLPKADGYVVARRIRKQAWGKSTVLVATTGWGQSSDKDQARRAGFNHHLVKPVDPDALGRILSQATVH
ncbi:MAG TPA: ATP-binding protein [Burkholderiales bacterium]|nr:ATP-binding protein [Burkholderiales bacterium]